MGEEAANKFRQWLLSPEGEPLRRRWFDSITDHTVLRYVDYEPARVVTDD